MRRSRKGSEQSRAETKASRGRDEQKQKRARAEASQDNSHRVPCGEHKMLVGTC